MVKDNNCAQSHKEIRTRKVRHHVLPPLAFRLTTFNLKVTKKAMFITVATKQHIEAVEALAKEIWTEHYIPIIGRGQVDYMLARFQSMQAISEQIAMGYLYFLIEEEGQFVGYVSVQPKEHELFLSKIYVLSSCRGKGYGKKAVKFVEELAKEKGLGKIVLTVNKNNTLAIKAYEAIGFKKIEAIVQDIGNGFVMDDYKMEKFF
jgi:ribosomal protein S18 acetylase RimI-like enzyme